MQAVATRFARAISKLRSPKDSPSGRPSRHSSFSSVASPSPSALSRKSANWEDRRSWHRTGESMEIQAANRESYEASTSSRNSSSGGSDNERSPSRTAQSSSRSQNLVSQMRSSSVRSSSSNSSSSDSVLSVRKRESVTRELTNAFKIIDTDNDGKISESELGAVLRLLGANFSDEETGLMMRAVDTDGDGYIDLREFTHHNNLPEEKGKSTTTRSRELRAAFQLFDVEKDDHISAPGLYKVLKGLGERTSIEQCRQMIRGVDCDGDGKVSFEEFEQMMS